ncbi:MAG: helicase-associated domain-containing protein, partial [Planctomycetales bacterium]
TPLGRAVFGAPDVELSELHADHRFLTVQPNHEIQVYLEEADAALVAGLGRFAARGSAASGPVQTFALRRESVYHALESGMSAEAIRSFLEQHGRTPLPDNVARSLGEWSGRRDALVLRLNVSLLVSEAPLSLPSELSGRKLTETALLLPAMSENAATAAFSNATILNRGRPSKNWKVSELGLIQMRRPDSLSRLRLAAIADEVQEGWQISPASVARAAKQGYHLERIRGMLGMFA